MSVKTQTGSNAVSEETAKNQKPEGAPQAEEQAKPDLPITSEEQPEPEAPEKEAELETAEQSEEQDEPEVTESSEEQPEELSESPAAEQAVATKPVETKPPKKANRKLRIVVLVAVIAVLAIAYLSGAYFFSQRFIPGTSVNGVSVSGKTVDEAKETLREEAANYSLTLKERGEQEEVITSESIQLDLDFTSDDTLDQAMAAQSYRLWFVGLFSKTDVEMHPTVTYDDTKLAEQIEALHAMQSENITKVEDATVSEYQSGQPYEVVPEVDGNQPRVKKTNRLIREYLAVMATELDMEEEECYREPDIRSDNEDLVKLVETMNQYINTTVTVKFSKKKTETVDAELVHDWLKVDEKKLTVELDEEKVSDYVSELASKYNTIYQPHKFTTTDGEKITIEQGDYGWWLNQNKTRDKIIKALDQFKTKTVKPVWLQEAVSHGKKDYGNTYVEVDLGNQILYFYKNGECLLSSYFVSGNVSTGHTTPGGIYSITYKTTYQRMVGADYDVLAYYWMPFNGDIGFHDATWRSSFGGSIYQTNGSHGCVNMPYSKAQTLYSYVEAGMPVICYY
ncbi:MAG: peptidoglycan binding domain-containing protein [Eubacteriales bacterium]|nr:peptidoglycan binding domain-containing protein [Eubacteriales bacterium]